MASTNAQPHTADALAEERKKMENMIKMHNKRETAWLNEKEKLLGCNHSLESENANLRSKFQENVISEKQKNDQLMQSMKKMEEKTAEDMKNKDEHIEELDGKLAKKNNEYRNEIKGKEEEYAVLVSKFEESVENEKKKNDRIKELEQNLKEEKEISQELETINHELEEENDKWTEVAEEINQKNKELREQMNKVEKECRENTVKMQTSNKVLKAEFEKQKNPKETLEKKNEELDEQIIVQKMKSSAPLNQTKAQQWYSTDKGNEILDEIFKKLKELFPLTELSKKINSQDIVIEIKADPVQVRFPSDFPNSSLQVMCGDKKKIVPIYKFAYNTASSHASFVHHVVSTLSTLM